MKKFILFSFLIFTFFSFMNSTSFSSEIEKKGPEEFEKKNLQVPRGGGPPVCVCPSPGREILAIRARPGSHAGRSWPKAWRTGPQLLNTVSRGQFGQCPSMGMHENYEISRNSGNPWNPKEIRQFLRKMENGGVRAVLVVPTARVLVYNYLPAPYLPAGGLPDRHVRHPTDRPDRPGFPKILKFAKTSSC